MAILFIHGVPYPAGPEMKLRARRLLKDWWIAVVVPAEDEADRRGNRLEGTVVWVSPLRDQVLLRTDSPIRHLADRPSNLVTLAPADVGDSFATLLERHKMRVRVARVDPAFLSVRRGNLLALWAWWRNPSIVLGSGFAVLVTIRPDR